MPLLTIEDVFESVGGSGLYQICIISILGMVVMLDTGSILANFIGYVPEHWCSVPQLLGLPYDLQRYIAAAAEEIKENGEIVYDSCKMLDLNYSSYSQDELINWNRSAMVTNMTGVMECQAWVYDQSIIVDNLIMNENLVCGESWKIDLMSSLTLAGFFFGSLIGGYVSDNFGRWPAICLMIVIRTAGLLVSAFYSSYWMICLGRFFAGMGLIGCYITVNVLVFEIVGLAHRTFAGTAIAMCSAFSGCLIPFYAFALREEKRLQIFAAIISGICLFAMWIVPESPRWLIINGKQKKAEKLLRYIAVVNDKSLTEDFDVTTIQIKQNGNDEKKGKLQDLFKSRILRRNTLILYCMWLTTVLTYFALSVNIRSLAGDLFINTLISGILTIPANFISMFTMNVSWIGRRWSNAGALLVAGISSLIAVPMLLTIGEQSTTTTVMAMIGRAGAQASFNVIYVFSAELYPTEVRNIGLGSCSMVSRIGGVIAPYVGGSMANIWTPLPSLIFGVTGCLSGIMALFLPETLGKKLTETITEAEEVTQRKSVHPASKQVPVEPNKMGHEV